MSTFERNCGNCACLMSVTVGEGSRAQNHYMCRLDPPIAIQQVTRAAVIASTRGDQQTTHAALLTYRPTMPTLVCWRWRPRGLPPGETIASAPEDARRLIAELATDRTVAETTVAAR